MANQTFLVGTGSEYIYACRLTHSGQLQLLYKNKSGKGPSWLLAHKDLLYAVNEQENKIEIFTIDERTQGKLTSKSRISIQGGTPCSLAIDPSGKWLAAANYEGPSNFVLLPLNKSNLPEENGAQVTTIDGHGPHKDRQAGSHCHQVQFYQGFLYVVDLGTDTISCYHYDDSNGQVRLNHDRIKANPGAGPRHLLFHPDQSLAFVANELDSTTSVYRTDVDIGKLEPLQTISTRRLEDEKNSTKENSPAEVHFSPDKKYLLVSNRGDDNIIIYNINLKNTDILSVKDHLNIQGSGPRYFTFDPTGNFLLIANQDTNNLSCFSYNPSEGVFTFVSQLVNLEKPQHIVFLS